VGRLIFFVLMFITWLALCWSIDIQIIIGGVVAAGIATALFGDMWPKRPLHFGHPSRYFWFLIYIPVFIWYMVKANIDVAYRVLHANVPINPGIVKVKTDLKSEMGQTFLANSITLTPGTLTVDIVDGNLYIHWINIRAEEPEEHTRIIVSRFERILRRIFE
jgi:multicomponent Na+:H+ antiporter subunit E